jgi:integrator complex subunit 9
MSSDNGENGKTVAQCLLNADEPAEEFEKMAFVCSCSLDSLRAGGSVLIPIGRLGIMLQLLEQISISLRSSDLKVLLLVPFFFISIIF